MDDRREEIEERDLPELVLDEIKDGEVAKAEPEFARPVPWREEEEDFEKTLEGDSEIPF